MKNKKNTLSNLIFTIALFLVVELVLTQVVLYSGLVWLHHAWSMTELQSNFFSNLVSC
ncbi:unnamed protein product [Fructobacillus cardui]|nr:unnamed protein product [Fructobacillus cardui]